MKIVLACDHGGYELKNALIKHLQERGIETEDLGCYSADPVDYPIYGRAAAEAVASGKADKGIVCCGTGMGISMAANKVKGIRCALPFSDFTAKMCKQHNNANMVSFGGRTIAVEDAIRYTDNWLDTEFEGGRHERRVSMIEG